MTIEAKIVCDSIGPNGIRLTTYVLKYPRFIHSEFMTHRMFSRNASSSRAIPFEKQVQMIVNDMAMPLEFRKNKKGMQAGEALSAIDQEKAEHGWITAANHAIAWAEKLNELGVHKQYVNRLIEPFSHISVVCTATEYSNFFALRHHSMAQPEIAELAKQMCEAYKANVPQRLEVGGWHLPFITPEEIREHINTGSTQPYLSLIKRSVARCARVSYLNHDGNKSSYDQDCQLYDRLLGAQPIHASPAEHQAQAHQVLFENQVLKWSANFRGWDQYRQTLKDQNITKFEGPLG
jgi:thymidylate synthase ThyX